MSDHLRVNEITYHWEISILIRLDWSINRNIQVQVRAYYYHSSQVYYYCFVLLPQITDFNLLQKIHSYPEIGTANLGS